MPDNLIRDELVRSREHFDRLIDNCIEFTGQEPDHTDEGVGAFCRYCCEELSLPMISEDIPMWDKHLKSCEVFKLKARINTIDALLGIKGND